MANILKSVKLDHAVLKAYYKIFMGVYVLATIIAIVFKAPAVTIPVVIVVAAPFISVYFLVYERNNLSKLYGILPLRRSEVVIGRYTYALLFGILNEVFSGILATILSLILNTGISYLEFLIFFSAGFLYVWR